MIFRGGVPRMMRPQQKHLINGPKQSISGLAPYPVLITPSAAQAVTLAREKTFLMARLPGPRRRPRL